MVAASTKSKEKRMLSQARLLLDNYKTITVVWVSSGFLFTYLLIYLFIIKYANKTSTNMLCEVFLKRSLRTY